MQTTEASNGGVRDLRSPVDTLRGVGPARRAQLERMGVRTVEDLLYLLPLRFEDRRQLRRLHEVKAGETVTVAGTIRAAGFVRPRFGKSYFEAAVGDDTGVVYARWFGAAFLKEQLQRDAKIVLHGRVSRSRGHLILQHPDFELEEGDEPSLHMGRIVPVYPLTEGLSQRAIRRLQWETVESHAGALEDILPDALRARAGLPPLADAVRMSHFPSRAEAVTIGRYRLAFDEFLCVQYVLAARREYLRNRVAGHPLSVSNRLRDALLGRLGFSLTGAQRRVLAEIDRDLGRAHPMHRLLQGDVGSGKTLVAACSLLTAVEAGAQGAIMAPTEILAAQHAEVLRGFFEPLGVTVGLLTGQVTGAERERMLRQLAGGELQVVAGTHALIQDRVQFKRLVVAVIDEQHRFGVGQRGLLYEKGTCPHILVMTATPIPRTLAMTMYGDLELSVIDEMPAGRPPIVTRVIRESQLPQAYAFIRRQVAKRRQVYMVYPVIGEAEASELRSATEMFERLSREDLSGLRLGLIHGGLDSADKEQAMRRFRAGEIDVLVSTSVIEVGIDVPNATVMLVEHAERFGLAQLHQLRGRVGRGTAKSFCILEGDPNTSESWRRLKVMEETSDGFRIAEEDLRIRGMGNLLGPEQSGMPPLRIADLVEDEAALLAAREEAVRLVEDDPGFEKAEYEPLRRKAKEVFHESGSFAKVG